MTSRIELDVENVYQPGYTIYGKAYCQLFDGEEFEEVKCILQGKEKTKWFARPGHDSSLRKGENTFLETEAVLLKKAKLPPGEHECPFAFTIPHEMPSSFIGKHGSVKYYITVGVKKGLNHYYENEIEFNVFAPVDLNNIRDLQLQSTCYVEEEVGSCFCVTGANPITMKLHLEKEAFVVGETVKVIVELENMSKIKVMRLDVQLHQSVGYLSTIGFVRNVDVAIVSHADTGVEAFETKTYLIDLPIPPNLTIMNFSGCAYLSTASFITATATVQDCINNVQITTEKLRLGHIPLVNSLTK